MTEKPQDDAANLTAEANRLNICAHDCQEALEYLDALLELQELDEESGTSEYFNHTRGLLVAAIVAYGRAFTKPYGGTASVGKVDVDINEVTKEDPTLATLHVTVIEKRNKAAAHSDWEFRKSERVDLVGAAGIMRNITVVNYQAGIDKAAFKRLARLMKDHFRFEAFSRDQRAVKSDECS